MAEEVVIKVDVELDGSIAEVKDLKQQFAEAEDAVFKLAGAGKKNTKEFREASLEAAKLKQEVDNINTSLDDLKPDAKLAAFGKTASGLSSGFAAATGAAALLGNESEDLQKTLIKVQAAMALSEGIKGLGDLKEGFKLLKIVILANPIYLIGAVLITVGSALFALKDKIEIVGKAFDFLGKGLTYIIKLGKDLADEYLGAGFAAKEASDRLIKSNEASTISTEKRYNLEIRAAKRAFKDTTQLEIDKLKALKKLNEEKFLLLNQNKKDNKKQLEEIKKANIEFYQTILDLEAQKAERLRANREAEKERLVIEAIELEEKRLEDEALLLEREQLKKDKDLQRRLDEQELDREFLAEAQAMQDEADAADEQRKLEAAALDARLKAEEQDRNRRVFEAAVATSDAIFAIKLRNVEAGSAEEEKILKKQFEVNKAFQLVNAGINGIQAIQAIMATAVDPSGITTGIRIAATAVATAANIAKIASSKFQGTTSTSITPSVPSPTPQPAIGGGAEVSRAAPQIAQTGQTQLNPDGSVAAIGSSNSGIIKAVVVESDITESQNSIQGIQDKATFV